MACSQSSELLPIQIPIACKIRRSIFCNGNVLVRPRLGPDVLAVVVRKFDNCLRTNAHNRHLRRPGYALRFDQETSDRDWSRRRNPHNSQWLLRAPVGYRHRGRWLVHPTARRWNRDEAILPNERGFVLPRRGRPPFFS